MSMSRLSLLLLSVAAAACAPRPLPAMAPVAALERAPAADALVVFVRPKSACDTGDHAVVVDARGAFLGNAAPRTQFAVVVPPGEHTFFVWPSLDLRNGKAPGWDPVGAIKVRVAAGEVHRIGVLVPAAEKLRCGRNATFYLTRRFEEGEVDAWLRDAQPMAADRATGQRLLDDDAQVVRAHVKQGQRQLAPRPEE